MHVITSTVGGAGMHVYYLAEFLSKDQFHTAVAFTPGQHLDYKFYEMGIDIVPLHMGRNINLLGMLKDYRMLIKYFKKHEIDIVQTHNTLAGIIGRIAAKRAGVPVRIHMIHTFAAHANVSNFKKKIYSGLERFLDRLTTHYIAGSDYIKREAVQRNIAGENKITRIYYAVDTEKFLQIDRSTPCINQRKKSLDIGEDTKIVGFVGRLEEQKGPDVFIEAFAQVVAQNPLVKAMIIGDGHLREMLEQKCAELGISSNVMFLGWRKDIPELFSVMDIFCLASRWEAFGIVFAEAGCLEVPVVSTQVEGIPEVVINGKSGFLVPKDSPDLLSKEINLLLENPKLAHEIGAFGKQYVLNNFSISKMISTHERLYKKLIA